MHTGRKPLPALVMKNNHTRSILSLPMSGSCGQTQVNSGERQGMGKSVSTL